MRPFSLEICILQNHVTSSKGNKSRAEPRASYTKLVGYGFGVHCKKGRNDPF